MELRVTRHVYAGLLLEIREMVDVKDESWVLPFTLSYYCTCNFHADDKVAEFHAILMTLAPGRDPLISPILRPSEVTTTRSTL